MQASFQLTMKKDALRILYLSLILSMLFDWFLYAISVTNQANAYDFSVFIIIFSFREGLFESSPFAWTFIWSLVSSDLLHLKLHQG